MTDSEKMLARAIAQVTYCPGIGTKRFAREMADRAQHAPLVPLTPKQSKYLCDVAIRYRRQVPEDIVRLARQVLAELEAAASVGAAGA